MPKKTKIFLIFIYIIILSTIIYILPLLYPSDLAGAYKLNSRIEINIINLLLILFIIRQIYKSHPDEISDTVLYILEIIYFLPGLIINQMYYQENKYYLYYIMYYIIFKLLNIFIPRCNTNKIRLNINLIDYKYNIVILTVLLLLLSLYLNNFKLDILSIFSYSKIYDLRDKFKQSNTHWLLWIPIMFGSMMVPLWCIIFYKLKKYYFIPLFFITMISFYSIGGNRVILFYLVISLIIIMKKYIKKHKISFFLLMIITLIFLRFDAVLIFVDIIRRTIVTPNVISYMYYSFFINNEPDYLRQALDRYLNVFGIYSKYKDVIPIMIANHYRYDATLNTGLIGTAISNYGLMGVIISPILYIISLRLVDFFTKTSNYFNNKETKYFMSLILAITITNSNNWVESMITPSFVILYYLSLVFIN